MIQVSNILMMDSRQNIKSDPLLRWVNLFAYLLMVGMNYLANAIPLGGVNTGEVAYRYDNLLLPSGYVFSIWGVIYLLLGIFIVWQMSNKGNRPHIRTRISWFFAASAFFNAFWIIAWHTTDPSVSLKIMFLYFISILLVYLRLRGCCKEDLRAKFIITIPFSILLAWLSFALIANITAFLVSISWGAFGLPEQSWAIIILILTFLLAQIFLFLRSDIFAALTLCWAWMGILLRRFGESNSEVLVWLLALMIIITLISGILIIWKKKLRNNYFS